MKRVECHGDFELREASRLIPKASNSFSRRVIVVVSDSVAAPAKGEGRPGGGPEQVAPGRPEVV